MSSTRNAYHEKLEAKIEAIRAGKAEDSLNPAEAILFACIYHKNGTNYDPITPKALSELFGASPTYLNDFVKGINNGSATKASKKFAAFLANVTGKDLDFWRRESYTLADAENIHITLPHEAKPEPTITGPAIQSKAVAPPTARELAEAVLFPPHVNSLTVAKIMKAGATNRSDISR